MLVLSRHIGEEIVIDRDIRITVVAARGRNVRLGIEAPPSVRVVRKEFSDQQAACESGPPQTEMHVASTQDSTIMENLLRVAR